MALDLFRQVVAGIDAACNGLSLSLTLRDASNNALASGTVVIDRLEVTGESATQTFDSIEKIRITGTSLPTPITFIQELLDKFAQAHVALVHGIFHSVSGPPRLIIDNIGSSGQDGVRILPRPGSSIANGLAVSLDAFDPNGTTPMTIDRGNSRM